MPLYEGKIVIWVSRGKRRTTPTEYTAFHNACNIIRAHIPDDNETPAMFEIVVTRIVTKALGED